MAASAVGLIFCFTCGHCRKGREEPELVYSTEANTKIPQMVIKFYESKLTWHDTHDS